MFKIDKFKESGFAVLQNLQKMFWLIFDCKAGEYYLQSQVSQPNIMRMLS